MREHIYRSNTLYIITLRENIEVARLGGRVTAYIYYLLCAGTQHRGGDITVHPGTGRIGDDHIRPPPLTEEGVIEKIISKVDTKDHTQQIFKLYN